MHTSARRPLYCGRGYGIGVARTVLRSRCMMDAVEVEFLAEKELVTITPNFSENKITLISVRKATNTS